MIDVQTRIDDIDKKLDTLLSSDSLTESQMEEHNGLVRLRETLAKTRLENERRSRRVTDAASPLVPDAMPDFGDGSLSHVIKPPRHAWIDLANGREVRVLSARERFAKSDDDNGLSIGRAIRGIVSGNWRGAELERLAISGSGSGGGTFLVPDPLSEQIIDLARAKSVLIDAGSGSVDMTSDTLRIAKVATDPTFEIKLENQAFVGSDIGFGSAMLTSRLIGTIVTLSRELAEDAPNAAQLVEDVLSAALAVAIDSFGLTAIAAATGTGETTSVGGILWEDIHNAVIGVRTNNYEPTAYVVSPTIAGDLDIITSGDGTNSAKMWLDAPPSLRGVRRFSTTSQPDATGIIGDFGQGLFGFRTGARIEATNEAANAFEKHQVKVKITQRFDYIVLRATAFHILRGITT